MTEMFGEAWSPMSVRDLAPDDDDDYHYFYYKFTSRTLYWYYGCFEDVATTINSSCIAITD